MKKNSYLNNDAYMTTKEAYTFLGISRSTFYRRFYKILIIDPTSRDMNGHPRYLRSTLEKFFLPINQKAYRQKQERLRQVCAERRMVKNKKKSSNQLNLFSGQTS